MLAVLVPALLTAVLTNLRNETAYEPPGPGAYARRTSRTLPKGAATANTYAYYASTPGEAAPSSNCAANDTQYGLLRSSTVADPDGGGSAQPITRPS